MSDPAGTPVGPDAAERRSRLLGVQLRALVGDHLGRHDLEVGPGAFPRGAALVVDDTAWVLIDGPAARSLGGALAWAIRNGARALAIVATADTGTLARRAQRFSFPIAVWFAQERLLLPAVPEPLAAAPEASSAHLGLAGIIEASGATPNVEHGVVFGEVRGLEVCRVVDQPTVGHFAELGDVDLIPDSAPANLQGVHDGLQLEVGVGANDREAFRLLHGDIPTSEALRGVVESVAEFRSADAPQHPLNRLGQERFLRWRLEQDPALIGMAAVRPAEPPVPRLNLKDPVPCVATATGPDGTSAMVVCTVGVDLDLVGYVADVQAASDERVVVAAPSRDLVPISRELLATLRTPVEIIPIP